MSNKLHTFMTTEGVNGKEFTFSLDEKNNLYVNDKRVVTHEIVQLRCAEFFVLLFTGGAVIIQAVFAVLTYYYR